MAGPSLWQRYDNGDNLLFKETDLRAPAQSALFGDLMKMTDRQTRLMVESLWHSCQASLEETPLIETLLPDLKATKVRVQGSPPGAARRARMPWHSGTRATLAKAPEEDPKGRRPDLGVGRRRQHGRRHRGCRPGAGVLAGWGRRHSG